MRERGYENGQTRVMRSVYREKKAVNKGWYVNVLGEGYERKVLVIHQKFEKVSADMGEILSSPGFEVPHLLEQILYYWSATARKLVAVSS